MAQNPALMFHIHRGERYYFRVSNRVNGDPVEYECLYHRCRNTYPVSILREGEYVPNRMETPITRQLKRYDPPKPVEVEVLPPLQVQQRNTPSQYSGGGGGGGLLLLGLLFLGAIIIGASSRD